MKALLKSAVLGILMALAAPWVWAERAARLCCGSAVWFEAQAEWVSLLPGRWGVWGRAAFYHLSLPSCPLDVAIQFGAIICHPQTELGHRVYVGVRSIIGWARVGDDTLLADHVQLLSGARQHAAPVGADASAPRQSRGTQKVCLEVGRDCWIGAQAVVMAPVGDASVIGAGAVVTRAIPAGVTAVGNPARVLGRGSAAGAVVRR